MKKRELPIRMDGSIKRPIRLKQEFNVWSLKGLENCIIYVENGKTFNERFWQEVANKKHRNYICMSKVRLINRIKRLTNKYSDEEL